MSTKKKVTTAVTAPAEPTAEELNTTKKGKKLVELAHKETGFFDSVTGFQIVRDQQVELGETIGAKTREGLQSGRLLVVADK